MRRIFALLSVVAAALAAIILVPSAHAATTSSTVLYMATNGSDSNKGTSGAPVKSLQRIKTLLKAANTTSAKIIVRPGTYYTTSMVSWDGIPQNTLTFRRSSEKRPVFDGRNMTGTSQYLMNSAKGPTLDIQQLQVQNYRTGGIRLDTNGNTVRNMIFKYIGNKHVKGGPGYAALHLLNSSNNKLINNTYQYLENSDCPGCVHAVYAANNSDKNQISDSRFSYITGDPVRLRHGTDSNTIVNNEFARSGRPATNRALVSFWRFKSSETCGKYNSVTNNHWDGRYHNGATGQKILGSGSEPGVARCPNAVSGSGNSR